MFMIDLKSRLSAALRCDFMRREDGTIALEAVIVMPLIFWTYLSLFSIFDAFRMYSIHQKAAYTIGDAISRETLPLDDAYLDGTHDLFEYLARSQGMTDMRVSQLWYDEDEDEYAADWSQVRGTMAPLTTADVKFWHHKLPVLPDLERIVLVETWSDYDPLFNTGLENREIKTYVFTRPRYAPRVCWQACN